MNDRAMQALYLLALNPVGRDHGGPPIPMGSALGRSDGGRSRAVFHQLGEIILGPGGCSKAISNPASIESVTIGCWSMC